MYFFVLAVVLHLLVVVPCGARTSEERPFTGLRFVEVLSIRIDKQGTGATPYDFEFISDISVDRHGRIYVLNGKKNAVYQFSSTGRYLRTFDFWSVQRQPYASDEVTVDAGGNVYVSNARWKWIAVADSTGRVMRTFPTTMRVSTLEAGRDGDVYISGLSGFYTLHGFLTYRGPIIHRLTPDGVIVNRFCARRPAGNQGLTALDGQGNVYYSFRYPHILRKYAPRGELVAEFGRNLPPARKPEWGRTRIESSGGAGDEAELELIGPLEIEPVYLFILPDGTILDVLRRRNDGGSSLYIDVYNGAGRFLASLSAGETGLPIMMAPPGSGQRAGVRAGVTAMAMDGAGHLYVAIHAWATKLVSGTGRGARMRTGYLSATLKKYRVVEE